MTVRCHRPRRRPDGTYARGSDGRALLTSDGGLTWRNLPGLWIVCDGQMAVSRPGGRRGPWQITGETRIAWQWLSDNDLMGVDFPTRRDALHALAASLAATPYPLSSWHAHRAAGQ